MRNSAKQSKKYKLVFAILFLVVSFWIPLHSAQAWNLMSFGIDTVVELAASFVFLLLTLIGKIIAALAGALSAVIKMRIYTDSANAPVVYQSWKIMRDFANMFFIIALIVMAFATIFDVAKYNVRTLIAKFLIAALLINFSLTLGGLVINGAQIINNTFLIAIGDAATRLGQDLNPSNLLPAEATSGSASSANIQGLALNVLVQLTFSVVLLGVFLFAILAGLVFTLIRIPIIWALLIVSPFAWVMSVFPQTSEYYKKWWHYFIGWCVALPVFLFFLYFGLYFAANIGTVVGAVGKEFAQEKIGGANFTFQTLFTYVLAAMFLIGGLIASAKISMFAGVSVTGIAGAAKKRALGYVGGTAIGKAAGQRLKQFQEERLPSWLGSEAAFKRKEALWGQRFGVRGMDLQRQKDFVDRANKKYADVQDEYDSGKVDADGIKSRAKQFNVSDPEGYALYKLLAKLGQLDTESFAKAVTGLKENSYAMRDFVKTAKDSNFSNVSSKTLVSAAMGEDNFKNLGPSFVGAQREIFNHIQSNAKILSDENLFSQRQFTKGLSLFGEALSTEGSAFIKEIGKMRPDIAADYRMSKEEIDKTREKYRKIDPKITDQEIRVKIFGESLTDIKDIASMPRGIWDNVDFQKALENKLAGGTIKAREQFFNNLQTTLRTATDSEKKIEILSKYAPRENNNRQTTETEEGISPPQKPSIVLTPGAQFEYENPEKVNVVDLRNPK